MKLLNTLQKDLLKLLTKDLKEMTLVVVKGGGYSLLWINLESPLYASLCIGLKSALRQHLKQIDL